MSRGDIYTILIVLGALFASAVIVLGFILSRMKIHQAIKLGEEG